MSHCESVAYRATLTEHTRERAPLAWAATQNNLGVALGALGEREAGIVRFEEAVARYHQALSIYEPARATFYMEMTRRNLARCEALLAERRRG